MTPNCSNSDQNHFEDCLKVLIQQCGYAIDGVREHENDTQPLLIRYSMYDDQHSSVMGDTEYLVSIPRYFRNS